MGSQFRVKWIVLKGFDSFPESRFYIWIARNLLLKNPLERGTESYLNRSRAMLSTSQFHLRILIDHPLIQPNYSYSVTAQAGKLSRA